MMIETGEQSVRGRFPRLRDSKCKCPKVQIHVHSVKEMKGRGTEFSQGEEWCIQDEFGQVIVYAR